MNLAQLRESLYDPRRLPLVYFSGGYAVALSVNVLSGLTNELNIAWKLLLIIAPIVVGVTILTSPYFKRGVAPQTSLRPVEPHKGLIAFVSVGLGSDTVRAAIAFHGVERLRHVWLFHSTFSTKNALELRDAFIQADTRWRDIIKTVGITNTEFDEPESVRKAIEQHVYENIPADLAERDIVIDVTGGTKMTTAGAFLVGLPETRRIEIVRPSERDENGRGTKPEERPTEVVISYRLKPIKSAT